MIEHRFTVEGKTSFPIDMLRYDDCLPDSKYDSVKITHSLIGHSAEPITVDLATYQDRDWKPAYGRWEIFSWKVTDHKVG